MNLELSHRSGEPPTIIGPGPHGQTTQVAPILVQEELWGRMRSLPHVYVARSLVSVPHTRALFLASGVGNGSPAAFQAGREFAHLHPHHDSSLHVMLPAPQRDLLEASGWGVPHPVQRSFLVYGPRDRDELEIVWRAVQWSYDFAVGSPTVAAPRHPQQGVTA